MNRVRIANLALSALGAIVFAALFLYVALAPADFDQRTREFAIATVERRVEATMSDVARSDTADRFIDLAGRYSDRLEQRLEALRASLDAGLDIFIADVLAAACELDCERRDEAQRAVTEFFENSIARSGFAIERVEDLIVGEYDAVMRELRLDLTIFSGSNAIALAFALLLAIFRGAAAKHLLPISLALTASTLLAIFWYVFGQDWLITIVFNDYWGWAYAIGLGVLSAFMIDIAVNKARATSFVLNGLGGAVNYSPC